MTELDAPTKTGLSQEETVTVTGDTPEDVLQKAKSQSQDIAEEALKKAALDITQEIKQYASADEDKRPSIGRSLINWVNTQIHHISQTVVALLIAAVVALVTPLLVKFELLEEIQNLSRDISSTIASNNTQGLVASTSLISDATQTIASQNNDIQSAFDELQARIGNESDKMISIETSLSKVLSDQDKRFTQLNQKLTSLQRPAVINPPPTYSPEIGKKLSRYIRTGTTLMKAEDAEREINNWIGEVYFFISLMPSHKIELDDVKENLRLIHAASKPFDDETVRVQKTITILKALQSWVSL